jgi:broad specificity phosphatase PhoE
VPVVYLVRHGEVENPRQLTYGCLPGFSLSTKGRDQAARTAGFLRRHLRGDVHVRSSPLERARETAEILVEGTGFHIDERLVEAGSWREGLPRAFEARAYLRRALDGSARSKSEAPRAVAMRMRSAVVDVLQAVHDEADVLIVSHQFPIWMARVAFERRIGEKEEAILPRLMPWLYVRSRCSHASVTTLRFEGTSLEAVSYWEPE